MTSLIGSFPSDPTLPQSSDVVVIGAGIVGLSTALELARKGLKVAVVEKGLVGAEQSSRNWGWVRQLNRDFRELPLMRASKDLWEGFAATTGHDTGFRRTGLLFAASDEKSLSEYQHWVDGAKDRGVHADLLTPAQTKAALSSAKQSWRGAIYCKEDGMAEPSMAPLAIAKAARDLGVSFHQECAARGMEKSAGRVSAVVTERGVIKTGAVVVAGGAWSSMFCASLGLRLPQASVNATAMRVTSETRMVDCPIATSTFCLRPRSDGGYTLALSGRGTLDLAPRGLLYARQFLPTYLRRRKGLKVRIGSAFFRGPGAFGRWSLDRASPFESMRILDPGPDTTLISAALASLIDAYPAVKGVRIANAWGGVIDSTPDAIPVISSVSQIPGLFLSTGYSGHGFGLGLGAGRLTADLIANDTPIVDPYAFRYSRFFDGTALGGPSGM
ncbi:NAD(P)/FAD-dependent oxidoreductase [Pandoraea communis]|uniref:FAD dependent oxidoreductase n=1 Tax=Pandoraea communis TaxID=2508297 RepID=A0A5E4SUH9_9BURK|nr:FAD-binding oxidoreductase [Pandoraea communis]MDM8357367.1 FAD-binding oxidoreductase [Pandoraea communis]VVD79195.1 FAD dependent oxidoreductase [Pandoraea communis]